MMGQYAKPTSQAYKAAVAQLLKWEQYNINTTSRAAVDFYSSPDDTSSERVFLLPNPSNELERILRDSPVVAVCMSVACSSVVCMSVPVVSISEAVPRDRVFLDGGAKSSEVLRA